MIDAILPVVKNYLPIIIAGVISLMLAVGLVVPSVQRIPLQNEEIARLTEEVSVLDQKHKTLQSLDLAKLNEMVQKTDVALPTEKSFPGLLSGLEALAREAGSSLLTFDSSPGVISRVRSGSPSARVAQVPLTENEREKSLGIKFLEANVGINSNAASLVDLTSTLTKSSRLVTLENVSYESSDTGVDKSNTKIKLRVYYQPEGATAAASVQFLEISQEERDLISKVDAFNRFTLELPNFLPSREDPFLPSPAAVPQATSSPSPQF